MFGVGSWKVEVSKVLNHTILDFQKKKKTHTIFVIVHVILYNNYI